MDIVAHFHYTQLMEMPGFECASMEETSLTKETAFTRKLVSLKA